MTEFLLNLSIIFSVFGSKKSEIKNKHICLLNQNFLPHFYFVKNNREEAVLKSFGNHLVKLRKDAGFSQKDFAFETDLEISQVYRIEKGKIDASLSTLFRFAKTLNISMSELLDFDITLS